MRSLIPVILTLTFLGLAPQASAQCIGSDNLDSGTCWQLTKAILPQFPNAALPGLGICWNGCTPGAQTNLRVDWQAPGQWSCDSYTTPIKVVDSTFAPPLVQRIGISPAIAAEVAALPQSFHRDPADRIIVSTARVHGATLLTCDRRIIDAALVATLE